VSEAARAASRAARRPGPFPLPASRRAPTAQHGTARHSTAQHGTARHSTAQHGTARHTHLVEPFVQGTSVGPGRVLHNIQAAGLQVQPGQSGRAVVAPGDGVAHGEEHRSPHSSPHHSRRHMKGESQGTGKSEPSAGLKGGCAAAPDKPSCWASCAHQGHPGAHPSTPRSRGSALPHDAPPPRRCCCAPGRAPWLAPGTSAAATAAASDGRGAPVTCPHPGSALDSGAPPRAVMSLACSSAAPISAFAALGFSSLSDPPVAGGSSRRALCSRRYAALWCA